MRKTELTEFDAGNKSEVGGELQCWPREVIQPHSLYVRNKVGLPSFWRTLTILSPRLSKIYCCLSCVTLCNTSRLSLNFSAGRECVTGGQQPAGAAQPPHILLWVNDTSFTLTVLLRWEASLLQSIRCWIYKRCLLWFRFSSWFSVLLL